MMVPVRLALFGEGPSPLSALDLTSNRVLPNSPHPSSMGERAGRPGSGSGSTQGLVGFAPPTPVSHQAASGITSEPPAMAGSQATRSVTTTKSCRNKAAPSAARALPSFKGFSALVRRWA